VKLGDVELLLDYHYWARDRLMVAVEVLTPDQFIRDMNSSFRSIRDTLTHTYSAEWVWHSRWLGHSPTEHVSPAIFADAGAIRRAWIDQEAAVRGFVASLDQDAIDRVIEYRLFNGQAGASMSWQIAQHVVNHASYHRGQVTTMLRQLGAPPPKSMDMIAFYRERSG
jgi:uncharacterized damage-inducible protein DinB